MKAAAANVSNTNRVEQPTMEADSYPARLVQVVDLGVQPQRAYQGQAKPPARTINVTYEIDGVFMVDEDGNELKDKPKWLSEDFPFYPPSVERSKCAKRMKVFDKEGACDGDISLMLGSPCTVTVAINAGKGKHEGKFFENISNVTPLTRGVSVSELVNEPRFFDLEEPNAEVFNALPKFLREKISNSLEIDQTPLFGCLDADYKMVGGAITAKVAAAPEPADLSDIDDDIPF